MLSCELTLQFDCDSVVMMHFVDDTTRLNLRLLGYQIDSRLRFLRTLHSSISFESRVIQRTFQFIMLHVARFLLCYYL